MTDIKVKYILPDGSEFTDESAPFVLKPGETIKIGKTTYIASSVNRTAWHDSLKITLYSVLIYLSEWN